ncbi:MAG: IS1595 family transposase [Proteobacteria bacterium]|nr:IS1595 family transposase [Pseudomonadota bacterium]
MARYTFKQFKAEYPTDAVCLDKIMAVQYGGTEFECPACKRASKFHRLTKRRAYACQNCGHHIYPCVGTPFEKSRTPLTNWFFAMYLMTSTRHGVAAKELERQLGCTYKTAWRIAHELRKLMAQADERGPLSGNVEIDETMIGGRRKGGKRGRGAPGKTTVMGMVERRGRVRAAPVPDVRRGTLEPAVRRNVTARSNVFTDELKSYDGLKAAGYQHFRVNHSAGEYVWGGTVHVNTIEGYWSRLKNSIKGTHVHVSARHLWKYVSEFSYRYNMRKQPEVMFDRLVAAFALPRLADG